MTPDRVLPGELRRQLRHIPVSALTTALSGHGLHRMTMQGVRQLAAGERMVAQAFAIRYIPSRPDLDNGQSFSRPDGLQRLAVEECPPGFALVIDARAERSSACAGDAYVQRLQMRGCAGNVTDGGLRDVAAISALSLIGLYPATEESRADYAAWRADRPPAPFA